MIREYDGHRFYVAVVSSGRPANVQAMQELVGDATWYVKATGEVGAYADQGAPSVYGSGGLCESRNMALAHAWKHGLPCVQLSDDLKKLRVTGGVDKTVPLAFPRAVAELLGTMSCVGARLGGCAPTDNAFFFNPERPFSTDRFIVGDFVVIEPCSILFDEQLRLKEDYDYTLQHLQRFGKVARRNDILATFAHRSNPGGAVTYRSPAVEQEAIRYLQAKWPGCLRPNPKRPNEVLLSWPPKAV